MTDARFTTDFDDLHDLLSLVDVDEVGDIETLLMFLFARPIVVEEVWDDDGVPTSLDVIVQGALLRCLIRAAGLSPSGVGQMASASSSKATRTRWWSGTSVAIS